MKKLLSGLVVVISYLGMAFCSIWAIVSFLIYLFKENKQFDWDSIWFLGLYIFLFVFSAISVAFYSAKEDLPIKTKGRFQERLEKIAKERENNKPIII